jgi:hypothetical protein
VHVLMSYTLGCHCCEFYPLLSERYPNVDWWNKQGWATLCIHKKLTDQPRKTIVVDTHFFFPFFCYYFFFFALRTE